MSSQVGVLRFINPGAACYINVVMQLLTQVRQALPGSGILSRWMTHLHANKMHTETNSTLMVIKDINQFLPMSDKYNGSQGDAMEVLNAIWNAVKDDAGITELYGIDILQIITCSTCSTISQSRQPAWHLQVPSQIHNLQAFFEYLFATEVMDGADAYMCDACNSKQRAVKGNIVRRWPPFLLFQIMRFDTNMKHAYQFEFFDSFKGSGPSDPTYVLMFIVCHQGNRDNGHYFGYGRVGPNTFMEYNDERCAPYINNVFTTASVKAAAYMLFYVKQ